VITSIIIIGIALAWLTWETDWFTIRLPYGDTPELKSRGIKMESNNISLTEPRLIDKADNDITERNPVTFTLLDMPDTQGSINIICKRL